jgi:hypothetical protein
MGAREILQDVGYTQDACDPSDRQVGLINLIIRDVAELVRNPLPGMHEDDMLVTANQLRTILEARFEEADRAEREQMDHQQYQSTVSA